MIIDDTEPVELNPQYLKEVKEDLVEFVYVDPLLRERSQVD